MHFRFFFVLTCLFVSIAISSNVRSAVPKEDLQKIDRDMVKVKAALSQIDRNMAQENKSFIAQEKKMVALENKIKSMEEEVNKLEAELNLKLKDMRKKFLALHLVMEGQKIKSNVTHILEQKILLKRLHEELIQLSVSKKNCATSHEQLKELRFSYDESRKAQNLIYASLSELQMKRESFEKIYIKTQKFQGNLQQKVVNQEVLKTLNPPMMDKLTKESSDSSGVFAIPVQQFKQLKVENSGVSFFIDQDVPVLAPGKGRVVYIGSLASYGQVIMLDHGNDLRTLILGELKVNVARNSDVREGEVLGYAQNRAGQNSKVYFEVRKRETPQAAMKYLKI